MYRKDKAHKIYYPTAYRVYSGEKKFREMRNEYNIKMSIMKYKQSIYRERYVNVSLKFVIIVLEFVCHSSAMFRLCLRLINSHSKKNETLFVYN